MMIKRGRYRLRWMDNAGLDARNLGVKIWKKRDLERI
jgi:hypothetical protein